MMDGYYVCILTTLAALLILDGPGPCLSFTMGKGFRSAGSHFGGGGVGGGIGGYGGGGIGGHGGGGIGGYGGGGIGGHGGGGIGGFGGIGGYGGGFSGGKSGGHAPWDRGDEFRMTGGDFGKKDSFFGGSFGVSSNPFAKAAGSFGKEGRPWEKMGGPHDSSDPPWGKGKGPWAEERAAPTSKGAWDKAYGDSKNGGYKQPWVSGKETYGGQVRSQKEQTAAVDFPRYGGYGDGSYDETEQGYNSKKPFGNSAGYGEGKPAGYGGSSLRSKQKANFGSMYGTKGYGTGAGYGETTQYTDPPRDAYTMSGYGPKLTQYNFFDGIDDDKKGFGNSAGYGKPKANGYGGNDFRSKQQYNFGNDKFRGGSSYGSGGFGKDVMEPHDYGKDPFGDNNWLENDSKYGPKKKGFGKTPRDIHSFDNFGSASVKGGGMGNFRKGESPFGDNIYAAGGHESNRGYFKTGGSKYKDSDDDDDDFGNSHGIPAKTGPGYHPKSQSRLTVIISSKQRRLAHGRGYGEGGGHGSGSSKHGGGGGGHGGGYGGDGGGHGSSKGGYGGGDGGYGGGGGKHGEGGGGYGSGGGGYGGGGGGYGGSGGGYGGGHAGYGGGGGKHGEGGGGYGSSGGGYGGGDGGYGGGGGKHGIGGGGYGGGGGGYQGGGEHGGDHGSFGGYGDGDTQGTGESHGGFSDGAGGGSDYGKDFSKYGF